MSWEATRWAWEQKGIKPAPKLVLLSMADIVRESNKFYRAIKTLCNHTSLDRKTVIKSIKILCDLGLVEDTGERKGETGQIVVYKLNLPNSTENGTVPKQEQFRFSGETVPLLPSNSTVFPSKESQKRDTDPIYKPYIEPICNHTNKNPPEAAKKSKNKSVKTTIPDDFSISQSVLDWYQKNGYQEDINHHLDNFIDQCQAKAYTYFDFDAAFKNAIRKDWADLRKQPHVNLNQQAKDEYRAVPRKVFA